MRWFIGLVVAAVGLSAPSLWAADDVDQVVAPAVLGKIRPGTSERWSLGSEGPVLVVRRQGESGRIVRVVWGDAEDNRRLLDFAFDQDATNAERVVLYVCFARGGRLGISRFVLAGEVLTDEVGLFLSPVLPAGEYTGATLGYSPDGMLYVRIAAGSDGSAGAFQDVDDLRGMILRINRDGSMPHDNPRADLAGVKRPLHPAVWAPVRQPPFNPEFSDAGLGFGTGGDAPPLVSAQSGLNIPGYVLPPNQWRQISLPADPGPSATVAKVFGDDIDGVYGVDWVMFRFDAARGRYVNPGENGVLEPGVGYWIIQNSASDVILALPDDARKAPVVHGGQCPYVSGCIRVPLTASTGETVWNLWGMPQSRAESWGNGVVVASGCDGGCSPAQAGRAGVDVLHSRLWSYNAGTGGYDVVDAGALLEPWKGYWGVTLGRAPAVDVLIADRIPAPLVVTTRQLVAKDHEVIQGRHFKCDGRLYQALVITGDDVTVEDNLFTDCYAGIIIAGAARARIRGNRFVHVGVAIREKDYPRGTVVTHNEFEGVGVYDCTQTPEWGWPVNGYWSCDVFVSVDGANGRFSFNRIDNRGYRSRWLEDFVNLYGTGGGWEVSDNLFVGSSEPDSSSPSGGCVVIDGAGSDYRIERNRCYETAGYGFSSAGGSDARFLENTVYLSRSHGLTLSPHPYNDTPAGSFGIGSSRYNGPCGQNVAFKGNDVFAYGVDVYPGQAPVDTGGVRNLSGGCPVSLIGNSLHVADPSPTIPARIFDGLDENYFSGRRGAP